MEWSGYEAGSLHVEKSVCKKWQNNAPNRSDEKTPQQLTTMARKSFCDAKRKLPASQIVCKGIDFQNIVAEKTQPQTLTCAALHHLFETDGVSAHLAMRCALTADPLLKAHLMDVAYASITSARSKMTIETHFKEWGGKWSDALSHLKRGISASPGCLQILHSLGCGTSSRTAAVADCMAMYESPSFRGVSLKPHHQRQRALLVCGDGALRCCHESLKLLDARLK